MAMRWKFGYTQDKKSQDYHERKMQQIDAWWKAFASKSNDLVAFFENRQKWNVAAWMQNNLQEIDDRIMWEFGPGLNGGHRLVITPEADRHLRPLVGTILEEAPKLEGWEFYPYRLPENVSEAESMLAVRKLAPINRTKVGVSLGEHHLVNLTFYSPDYSGPDDKQALNSAFVAIEVILGEQILDTWIGDICVQKATCDAAELIELDQLRVEVEKHILDIKAKLPVVPAWRLQGDTEWTLWELKPEKRNNYASQLDLFLGKSMCPAMWTAAHSNGIFYSERFSSQNELFCYLKIDGSVDLSGEKFDDKVAIEDSLDEALKKSGFGAVVGGGTGLRYSYVDLALTDIEEGIQRVIEILRGGRITKRAWILFFDDIYANEWIGVWDDSPSPPGMEHDLK